MDGWNDVLLPTLLPQSENREVECCHVATGYLFS